MCQIYDIWIPVLDNIAAVSVVEIIDDSKGFCILLREHQNEKLIRISFEGRLAYQNRDESDLDGEASRSEGLGRGCFYIVRNSEFIARFRKDTVRYFEQITHFAIITDADCIDVLALEPPIAEYL